MNTTVTASLFSKMVQGGAMNLYKNRGVVNDLNVFPIPDGDTGDNMYMTMQGGAEAVKEAFTLADSSSVIARGMLLGARGNSGVILSRIFAGLAEGFTDKEEATVSDLHNAFLCGVRQAYKAVSVPVEGTILTVCREAVEKAGQSISQSATLLTYFDVLIKAAGESLERTPDLLPVLKEAGVVDSGGAGFICILEGMKDAANGKEPEQEKASSVPGASKIDISSFTEDSVLAFGYCTEFLLRLQKSKCDPDAFDIDAFTAGLCRIGESVVTFREGTVIKAHVHTMHPGEVLDFGQRYGEFLTLKIENMMLQHNEATVQNRFSAPNRPHKAFGTVTVAAGRGLQETFTKLGVDAVVEGGQSMNPSASDFIDAFERINADTVLVYPNNSNVILTAEQAASLYEKAKIVVIPTKTVGEGYAALSMLDTSSKDIEQIRAEAADIISTVVTGAVSRANRTSDCNGVSVVSGDYIGFVGNTVYTDMKTRNEAALALASALKLQSRDLVLLLIGAGVPEEEAEALTNELTRTYRRTEIIPIRGDQPIYDYILILE